MKTNKKLISLMLAGAMVAGVSAMATGCDERASVGSGNTEFTEEALGENLIVALYNKKITLHKAKVTTLHSHCGYGGYTVSHLIYTDCDIAGNNEGLPTEMYTIYPNGVPDDEELYDNLCEECFGHNK